MLNHFDRSIFQIFILFFFYSLGQTTRQTTQSQILELGQNLLPWPALIRLKGQLANAGVSSSKNRFYFSFVSLFFSRRIVMVVVVVVCVGGGGGSLTANH